MSRKPSYFNGDKKFYLWDVKLKTNSKGHHVVTFTTDNIDLARRIASILYRPLRQEKNE